MLTVQWCLFDLFNKGRLPPLSSPRVNRSCAATFSIVQLWTLFCSSVHGCLCSEASIFFYGRRWGGTKHNPLHPFDGIFIYFPLPDAILVLQNPRRRKCIKPLTVFTCVGLMLMLMREGRLEDGGWEIDHRRMSVRGRLISTTAFHAFDLEESVEQKRGAIREYSYLPRRLRHWCLFRRAHSSCALYWTVRDN